MGSMTRRDFVLAAGAGTAADHGFTAIADVDIMDADGQMSIPVMGGSHLSEDIVGANLANYDHVVWLAHFKGHAMGGFGGALKNCSIGIASADGKRLIRSAGTSTSSWGNPSQDDFLESMAEAAKAVSDYLEGHICYVNVMSRLSVDCDCDSSPAEPDMADKTGLRWGDSLPEAVQEGGQGGFRKQTRNFSFRKHSGCRGGDRPQGLRQTGSWRRDVDPCGRAACWVLFWGSWAGGFDLGLGFRLELVFRVRFPAARGGVV